MNEAGDKEYLAIGEEFVLDYEIQLKVLVLTLRVSMSDRSTIVVEANGVLSHRFTSTDVYDGYVEGSLNHILVLDNPAWPLLLSDEEGIRGDFVRERKFFHIDIDDVGILECYATSVKYGRVPSCS